MARKIYGTSSQTKEIDDKRRKAEADKKKKQ